MSGPDNLVVSCCLCPATSTTLAEAGAHADRFHGGQFHDNPGGRCSGCRALIMPADLLPDRKAVPDEQ